MANPAHPHAGRGHNRRLETGSEPCASRSAAYQWLGELLDGHGTGRAYQNFPDQKLADPLRSYYGQNLPRLRDVKRHYDPDNFFCHQQSIPLGTDKTDS